MVGAAPSTHEKKDRKYCLRWGGTPKGRLGVFQLRHCGAGSDKALGGAGGRSGRRGFWLAFQSTLPRGPVGLLGWADAPMLLVEIMITLM